MSIANRTTTILDYDMAWYDGGSGETLVFLHGNPTSSYLWRNVIAPLERRYRCIAPDLIGMGRSAKLRDSGPDRYTFDEHARFLDALLDEILPAGPVTLVIHDWGSALGFDWARRHADRVRGIAYMEAIVKPIEWSDWPENARGIFEAMRSPAGEELVLEKNVFIENILPASILRKLDDDEMDAYRAPFRKAGEDRRPTLSWPRQIPLGGEPQSVCDAVAAYGRFFERSEIPKLFINADPGIILIGAQREYCRGWPNQKEVTVSGLHFIQEDSAEEIAAAIADWRATP